MQINTFDSSKKLTEQQKSEVVTFLFDHLDQYGDAKEDIDKAITYALGENSGRGGSVIVASNDDGILGVVVLNQTGMQGYIPENILVYIAVHDKTRGQGLGKILMEKAIDVVDGGIALHVEPDNPAKHLYERMGFTNKYLEMRYTN
jgi:[ribosomal protein S18]-alanine N-acetyltransferase